MKTTISAAVIAACLAVSPAYAGNLGAPVVEQPIMVPATITADTAANSSMDKGVALTIFMAILLFTVPN